MGNEGRWYSLGVELSEENPRYLELEDVVGYYNYPNGNGRQMNYGDTEEEQAATLARAQTLINMPVKAKYAVNALGQPTFKGHEAKFSPTGELVTGTEKIGTHSEVKIEERDVVTYDGKRMHLPCLVAKQIVWKDNKNVVAAIKRLFSLGKLHTSWEVQVSAYTFKDGIKYLDDYAFLGNAMLGYEYSKPAYGEDAKVISLASQDEEGHENYELMVAEALSQDMIERGNEVNDEVPSIEENNIQVEVPVEQSEAEQHEAEAPVEPTVEQSEVAETPAVEQPEEQPGESSNEEPAAEVSEEAPEHNEEPVEHSEDTPEEEGVEHSTLTGRDIVRELEHEADAGCVIWNFPEEHVAWFHHWEQRETVFTSVTYEVTDGHVVITNREEIELVIPARNINETVGNQEQQIAELKAQVVDLQGYKEKWDASEAAAQKAKHDKEVSELKQLAENAKCFSDKELSAMADMFEGLRVAEVKAAIYDKKMAAPQMAEVSEEKPRQNIDSEAPVDRVSLMRSYLHRN